MAITRIIQREKLCFYCRPFLQSSYSRVSTRRNNLLFLQCFPIFHFISIFSQMLFSTAIHPASIPLFLSVPFILIALALTYFWRGCKYTSTQKYAFYLTSLYFMCLSFGFSLRFLLRFSSFKSYKAQKKVVHHMEMPEANYAMSG